MYYKADLISYGYCCSSSDVVPGPLLNFDFERTFRDDTLVKFCLQMNFAKEICCFHFLI